MKVRDFGVTACLAMMPVLLVLTGCSEGASTQAMTVTAPP